MYHVCVVHRHRQAGDSKYMAKLSLEELQAFSEQVNELPCRIREAALVEVRLWRACERNGGWRLGGSAADRRLHTFLVS